MIQYDIFLPNKKEIKKGFVFLEFYLTREEGINGNGEHERGGK